MGKPKAPKPPDLSALNTQQAQQNKDAAYDVMNQNRYGQVSPFASNTWDVDPVTGKTTNVTKLSPEQQALYEKNNTLAQAMTGNSSNALNQFMNQYWGGGGGATSGASGAPGAAPSPVLTMPGGGGGSTSTAIGTPATGTIRGSSTTTRSASPGGIYGIDKASGVGGVGTGIQGDLDYSKLTAMPTTDPAQARQEAQDALYKMNQQYLDPQWQEAQRSNSAKLSNQGLVPGTPAYDNAMRNLNDAQQKAYESARQGAIAGGGAEAERAQAMALQLRNQGMTEAGNLGAFHNAAQGQRAGQLLSDVGQQRNLEGTLGAANIGANASMANAGLAAQSAAARLGLDTRSQGFNELMSMGKFGQGGQMLPQFGINQGNLQNYGTGDLVGTANKDYANQLAYNQSKGPGFMEYILNNAAKAATAYGGS